MRYLFFALVILLSASCRQNIQTEISGLVPEMTNPAPDYWCTWGAQNFAADTQSVLHTLALAGHSLTAEKLNEENLFGEDGWSSAFPDELKKDLLLVLDVGWDVPSGMQFENENWRLGSLLVARDKFPSCTGDRAERLSRLNELVLDNGWKGTGLWLPSHPYEDYKEGKPMEDTRVESYYIEALEICKKAGIKYWKIDYGYRGDITSRKKITSLAERYYPELIIEHGRGSGPLNDEECPWESENFYHTGSFRKWGDGAILDEFVRNAKIASVLRTYDITQQLSIPTTLDRVAQVMAELSGSGEEVIINCEDEPYIGAVLGCAIGIMRHPDMIEMEGYDYDPFNFKYRKDELVRAVKWHRIAPAVGAGLTKNILDTMRLTDDWTFREGDSWAIWMNGKEAIQAAPARISRGMPLPLVTCDEDPPYVLCALHPNGALAVGTLPRVSADRTIHYPLADVSVDIISTDQPIGIFGRFNSLTLVFGEIESLQNVVVYGQDLAGDRVEDISNRVAIDNNRIKIPGDVIDQIGLSAASEGDLSEPGLVIKFL